MTSLLRNKWLLLLSMMVCLTFGLAACSNDAKGELIYTTAEDVMMRMENDETFVVYLGTTTCSFCIKYKTELEDVIKKKEVTIYGVMINEGNRHNNQILMERFQLSGTPETYWIVGGVKQDSLVGYVPYQDVIDWLKTNEVIP